VPPCQSRSCCTPVRAHSAREPRAPSIGSTQCLATPGAPQRWDESFHTARLVTPASQPVPCRRVRVMAHSWLLPRAYRASKPAWHPEEDASLQSLQSTCCQGSSQDCSAHEPGAFALRIPATLVEPSDSARLYRARHKPSTETRASRCRHHLPRVANRFGAGCTSCDLAISTSRGRLEGVTRAGVVSRCTSRDSKITGASLHPPSRPRLPRSGSAS
jgi:hypothetical protein